MKNQLITGTLLAAAAALAFGVSTPLIQRLGVSVGPLPTAALLYFGAASAAIAIPRGKGSGREPPLRPSHLPRLLAVALFGSAIAPTLFAWGLQRVPALYGSLLLNGEAVFTVVLAALFYREHVGPRIGLAVALMAAGGVVTVASSTTSGPFAAWGALAIVAAVLAWALDNVLTRPLADLDPSEVIRAKALLGASFTSLGALWFAQSWPTPWAALGLFACGASGYGLSLRLYLLAQRHIGAGRTGSVFAVAPFLGALTAIAMGQQPGGIATLAAATLFIAGLILHLTEAHVHQHEHPPLTHEHPHRHDDGHHDHCHQTPVTGHHTHTHTHQARVHAHPHGPDIHHRHDH